MTAMWAVRDLATAAFSAVRLEQIGTPADVAESSDWDRVSEEFVGLRGLGNVAWYPVASIPVALGDGARFFTEAAAERQRQSQATVSMQVTEEFFGEAPNLAVLDGTDFYRPDSQVGDVSGNAPPYGGNPQPLLTTFPFLSAPSPLPGETGTINFPVQQ